MINQYYRLEKVETFSLNFKKLINPFSILLVKTSANLLSTLIIQIDLSMYH